MKQKSLLLTLCCSLTMISEVHGSTSNNTTSATKNQTFSPSFYISMGTSIGLALPLVARYLYYNGASLASATFSWLAWRQGKENAITAQKINKNTAQIMQNQNELRKSIQNLPDSNYFASLLNNTRQTLSNTQQAVANTKSLLEGQKKILREIKKLQQKSKK